MRACGGSDAGAAMCGRTGPECDPQVSRIPPLPGGHHVGERKNHAEDETRGGGKMVSASADRLGTDSRWTCVWRWLFSVEPMRHAWWETFIMRAIIAWAVWISLVIPAPATSQPHPHGLAAWGVDFTWLGDAAWTPALQIIINVCLVLYV